MKNKLNDLKIVSFWTSTTNEDKVIDFINVQKKVFGDKYNMKLYEKKYNENIFGNSLIILAYLNEKCIGARAFWRNDLGNIPAYQPCDTAVLEGYRGCGVFSKMTLTGLEALGGDTVLYNFPNDKSYPGYIKLGWSLKDIKKYKIVGSCKDLYHLHYIDTDYTRWLIDSTTKGTNDSIFYVKKKNKFYLVKRRKWNIFLMVGEIDEKFTNKLRKAKFPIALVYSNKGNIGRGIFTVTKNIKNEINIPVYKIDTLI